MLHNQITWYKILQNYTVIWNKNPQMMPKYALKVLRNRLLLTLATGHWHGIPYFLKGAGQLMIANISHRLSYVHDPILSMHGTVIQNISFFFTCNSNCEQNTKKAELHTHTRLTALFPGLPRWASTRKVKPIWILLKQETVSGSGIS